MIAERIGWPYSIRMLSGRVAELRPVYLPPDPASRTSYVAGEIAQFDLWFPPIRLPVGFGQTRTVDAAAGADHGLRLLPVGVRGADSVPPGGGSVRRLVAAARRLGAVPRVLVWDGRARSAAGAAARSELTVACQGFRGTLAREGVICRPADPEAKGLVERLHDYLERSFLPGRTLHLSGRLQHSALGLAGGGEHGGSGGRWVAHRPSGSPPTGSAMLTLPPVPRPPAGGPRSRWRGTTTCGWTATTTRCIRRDRPPGRGARRPGPGAGAL